jgi:hypothetical protein
VAGRVAGRPLDSEDVRVEVRREGWNSDRTEEREEERADVLEAPRVLLVGRILVFICAPVVNPLPLVVRLSSPSPRARDASVAIRKDGTCFTLEVIVEGSRDPKGRRFSMVDLAFGAGIAVIGAATACGGGTAAVPEDTRGSVCHLARVFGDIEARL